MNPLPQYYRSDDDDDEEGEDGVKSTTRKREKLTRAQLNRRTARNIASFKESRKKEQKALLKSLDSLPHVIKSIEIEEKRIEDMKAIREVCCIQFGSKIIRH